MSFSEPTINYGNDYNQGTQNNYNQNAQNYVQPPPQDYNQPPPANYNQNPQASVEQKGGFRSFLKTMFRIVLILNGLFLVALGVLSIVFMSFNPFHIVTIFLGGYVALFGAMMFFAEFRWTFFILKFPFLLTRVNRGFFMIFVGSLCFGMYIKTWSWPCYVIGGWTIFWGVVYVIHSCCTPDQKEQELKEKVKSDLENQGHANANPTPASKAQAVPSPQV